MALSFSGSGQYLTLPSAAVATPPFSFSCWFKLTTVGVSQSLVSISNNSTNNSFYCILMAVGVPNHMRAQATTVGVSHSASTGTPLVNTWMHCVAVFAGDTSRTVYVNGVASGTDVSSGTGTGLNISAIGCNFGGTATAANLVNGAVAYAAIHNIALSAGDVSALYNGGAGVDPATVQGANCVSMLYMTSSQPFRDTPRGSNWTAVGTPTFTADPFSIASTVTISGLADVHQADINENGFDTYSYYLAPWKSYMDTWPGARFLDGIGVNFRPGGGNEAGTAQLLAQAGVTHARIEFGWSSLNFANDTQIGSSAIGQWTAQLNALKANGIRPLILLNCNLGGMAPFTLLSLTTTAASAIGATTITVSSVTGVVLGKTGLTGQKSGWQTYPFIKSIAGLVCTLSSPLLVAYISGATVSCVTLKYHPLCTGGTANSFSAETMTGWATYTRTIATFVKGILGNNNFDIEVINEDQTPLDDNFFYSPANTSTGALTYTSSFYPSYTLNGNTAGDNRNVLVPITVDVIKTEFPGVRIINGMSNLRPQDNAFNTPPGVLAFSRHNYTNLNNTVTLQGVYGVSSPTSVYKPTKPPINALFGYDGTPSVPQTAPAGPNPATVNAGSFFVPTFTLSCPEGVVGMGFKHEWMATDLLPFPGLLVDGPTGQPQYRGLHWRGGINPITGTTVGLWETETNVDRKAWVNSIMTTPNRDSDPASVNLWMFMGAKCLLRLFVFYIHKGIQTVCLFSDRNPNEPYVLSMIPETFFNALSANGGVLTPAITALVGSQITALENLTSFFSANTSGNAFTVSPVTVPSISSSTAATEWVGDGTAAHPDQTNLQNIGFFPFQLDPVTYAIPYYVVTHDVSANYGVNGNILDTANYRMPEETYDVTFSGFNGLSATALCYDPLSDSNPVVSILARSPSTLQVRLLASDTPRVLLVQTSGTYPQSIDNDAVLGPTTGIVSGLTPMGHSGGGAADQLTVTQNLIGALIALETKAGITNSSDVTTLDYQIRKYPFKLWGPGEGSPTASGAATLGTRNNRPILSFSDTATNSTLLFGVVPSGATLSGGVILRYTWMSATATTGNVVWGANIERLVTDEDADNFDTQATVTTAAPGTAGTPAFSAITLTTIDGLQPGDGFCLRVQRLGASASDTMTGLAQLQLITIESAT